MRRSLRRQAEWLFLLSLSSAIFAVTGSIGVSKDSATMPILRQVQRFKVDPKLYPITEPNQSLNHDQFTNRETATNVFSDLCRFYSNLLVSPFSQNQADSNKHPASIEVVHDIFDPSFGLVPYITYTVQVSYKQYERGYLYVLQVNEGKVTTPTLEVLNAPNCESLNKSSHHLVQLTSQSSNLSWVIKNIPETPTNLTLRLLAFSTETLEVFSLAWINYTILPGCYLKLHSARGVVSSSHLPTQFDSTANTDYSSSSPVGCFLLLHVPTGSSAELTLRKLKLPRSHSRECHEDSQLLLATSTSWDIDHEMTNKGSANNRYPSRWFSLVEVNRWQQARSFCGKIQDYAKNLRTWRTFDPWVLIHFRGNQRTRHHTHASGSVTGGFFALKFNVLGPCLNLLFTERSKTIELSDSDFGGSVSECTFRIHVPYGYRVHLLVHLLVDDANILEDNPPTERTTVVEDEADNNSLLLHSGKCQVVAEVEDTMGHHVQCLHRQRPSESFYSANNVLKFHAMALQSARHGQENRLSGNNTHVGVGLDMSQTRLRVLYTSEADPRLTKGCGEGVLADDTTCVWLHSEPLPWQEAEAKCNRLAPNGHLVAITNYGIQQVVDAVIANSAHYEPSKSYWIGGSDQKQETIFEWSSGATFSYTKWFSGWPMYQMYNAQPSDDGISNQDCIETRQSFGQPGQSESLVNGFFWNDRDCLVANPFVCQKPRIDGETDTATEFQDALTCNRTEELTRLRSSTTVQSPFFPRPYPHSVNCVVDLLAPVGFKIVLNFDYFDLEEEEDCNYDALDLQNRNQLSISAEQRDATLAPWKRCGNWNSRLKLLRWKSNDNEVRIRFTSDSSYSGNGFQLVATIERAELSCPETGALFHRGHCYLIAPYPEIGWVEANQVCRSMESELVHSDSSSEELRFLVEQIYSNEQLNNTAFYWVGQTSDSNRFQLSIPHSVDAVQQCPSLRIWSSLINATLNMEPCGSSGGYICEKIVKSNYGMARNSSIESREGEVKSPNHPAPYGEGNHFRLHIKAPNGSASSERLVMRFKQIDIEFQENCLYDYLGLQSREDGPMQKICGQYTTNLDRLDYVSETSEVWLTFHSDFSVSGNGFHAVWSTMQLGCPQQTLDQPQGDLFSPHYPNYYLPHLNCTYHLLAPVGTRVWIKFSVFEIGFHNGHQQLPCRDEYVRLAWGSSNPITICGTYNLSRETLQWISDGNQLSVQLISSNGKQGRGFHASYRFVPIPTTMADTVFLNTDEEVDLVPFNYPHLPPRQLRQRVTLLTHHGSYFRHQAASWLKRCQQDHDRSPLGSPAASMVVLTDPYSNNTEIELCYYGNETTPQDGSISVVYESMFHTLTVEYYNIDTNWSAIFGRVKAIQDPFYAEKISSMPEDSPVDSCDHNPCQNKGLCKTIDDQHYCQCSQDWRGLFCSLTLCQLTSPCHHGTCTTLNDTQRCTCNPGFTGYLCDAHLAPCDLDPCGDRGKCVPSSDGFICQCHPWWQGPRCETRWLHLPYKPLSQRMLEEPFWLGLMTIATVLIIIAIVWCARRHFAEKFERFVSEELERGKLVEPAMLDWTRGRHCHRSSVEASAASRPISPQTCLNIPVPEAPSSQRHFLGWPGFRKPSLLSITSLISPSHSHTSVAGPIAGIGTRRGANVNRGQSGGRTFSLDDLFRLPKRSPSPSKRGSDNDVATQRREMERQQILQRLIASQIPSNRHGTNGREAVMMTQLGQNSLAVQDNTANADVMETTMAAQLQLQLDLKAEKKVTFARMMEMVKADISSSETETSAGEELNKSRELAVGVTASEHRSISSKRKPRNWNSRRFWRSNNSNSSTQGSASDQDVQDSFPSTDNVPTANELECRDIGRKGNRHLRLPSRAAATGGRQASSTESLLNIIRNFSAPNHRTPSTPSSPQVSDYELSSSFPTPLSTPGSPAGSLEVITPSSNTSEATSIQVTVIDPTVSHRNNRAAATNLAAPHITLEIPTVNYGQFLSPIHEVPTPLPSPAHTPIPSLRKADRSGTSDSSSSINSQPQRKRAQLQQQKGSYYSSDESHTSMSSAPSIVIENAATGHDNQERHSISIVVPSPIQIRVESDSAQHSPVSSASNSPLPSPAKTKPPPLQIINSNFARFEALETGSGANDSRSPFPLAVPILCVSEPSPDTNLESADKAGLREQPSKKLQRKSVLDWQHVDLGSPPLRKLPDDAVVNTVVNSINDAGLRRAFKDALDKSSSLDLPHPPPMITITSNFSEVDSDSDASILGRGGMNNQKMCYLSPFACYGAGRQDIATSESNLSSSGYSSMASPGPSPSCSSKTLCILEEDMALGRSNGARKNRHIFHRALLSPSLESSSPPPDSPPEIMPDLRSLHRMGRLRLPSDSEVTDEIAGSIEMIEQESTADYESHDEGIDIFPVHGKTPGLSAAQSTDIKEQNNFVDQKLINLIRTHKSTSLDSKLVGQRRSNLKSDSLDTKLLVMQPNGTSSITLQSLQLPEPLPPWVMHSGDSIGNDEAKKSPVSSRSESPLSDAKSAGFGRFSSHFYGMSRTDVPYTDSDGLYDYPSSEAVLPPTSIPRRHARKCDRRRERKTSLKSSRVDHHHRELLDGSASKRSFLEPGVDRGGRLVSAKRRIRAQSNIDFCASSSSNESLTSSSKRLRRKKCPQLINMRRGSSPICDVILTIQAASSVDESQSEVGEERPNEIDVAYDVLVETRAFKLPGRNRQTTQPLRTPERRRIDSGSKRRELSSGLRSSPRKRKVGLSTEGSSTKGASSTSSCNTESDVCDSDSNESLANLGEIEDSVDSPPDENVVHSQTQ